MATRKRIASGVSPFEETNFCSGNVAGPKALSSFENETDVGLDPAAEVLLSCLNGTAAGG
jgi:hypothetical protein